MRTRSANDPSAPESKRVSTLFDNPRLFDWWGRTKFILVGAPIAKLFPDLRSNFYEGIDALNQSVGSPCLDIGGGRGELAQVLSARGQRVVALDRSMVQCRLLKKQYPNLEVVRGDATRLPFEDGAFGTTLFRAVLHHIENPRLALMEARRTSRRSLVLDHIRDERRIIGWMEKLWLYLQDDRARPLSESQWRSLLESVGICETRLSFAKSLRYFLYFRIDWPTQGAETREGSNLDSA